MDKNVQTMLKEWEFIRSCTTSFIGGLSDADLDAPLPRRGLDTFRKHCEELISVQGDYITAITSGTMRFTGPADAAVPGNMPKAELLSAIDALDTKLAETLEVADPATSVIWFGQPRSLVGHLAALIDHEAMHIGQSIAFCYALGIAIPDYITREWALSGE